MRFSEVIGLERTKKELSIGIANNRIAHAQLFYGSKGSGKLALAVAYARRLNCESLDLKDSCNSCPSSLKFSKLIHPDLHIIFPIIRASSNDNKTSDDYIVDWREQFLKNPYFSLSKWLSHYKEKFLEKTADKKKEAMIYSHQIKELNRKLTLKVFEAKYRVVIIWMPEKMNIKAANKFLKLLEEPPKKTILLLVSEDKGLIIDTILSRLQHTRIPSYTVNETIENSKTQKSESFLNFCRLSNGNMGKVWSYSDSDLTPSFLEDFKALNRLCFKNNFSEISDWCDETSSKTRQQQRDFLSYCLTIFRECLVYNFSDQSISLLTIEEKRFLENFAKFVHEENSIPIINLFESAIKKVKRNANSKIIFFQLALELSDLLKLKRKFAIQQ
ncbi:MAG: ATP-binding protein [Flavobacteriales bacterium]